MKRAGYGLVRSRRRALCAFLLLITTTPPFIAWSAQSAPVRNSAPHEAPAFYLGINIAVATISAWLNHGEDESILRAMKAGAIGGTLMYAGQRIVATQEPALRLVGIQTVAFGASLARNMGAGVSPTATLVVPAFPFYVTLEPAKRHASVRVSAAAVVGIVNMAWHGRKLDLVQSLYSGALVFSESGEELHCYVYEGDQCVVARVAEHRVGSVAYSREPYPASQRQAIAHELGHVTQDVRELLLFAVPASDYALKNSGKTGRAIANYVVIDAFLPLTATSDLVGPPRFDESCRGLDHFYECEVYALIH